MAGGAALALPTDVRAEEQVADAVARTVGHFGGIQATKPLPVSLVVITEYRAGARWQPKSLTPGQGILEILRHTNNSLRQPQIAVQVLQKVAIQAKIIKSKRGEAKKIAQDLLKMC